MAYRWCLFGWEQGFNNNNTDCQGNQNIFPGCTKDGYPLQKVWAKDKWTKMSKM